MNEPYEADQDPAAWPNAALFSEGDGAFSAQEEERDPEFFLELVDGGLAAEREQELRARLTADPDLARRFSSYQERVALLHALGRAESRVDGGHALRLRILADAQQQIPEASGRSFRLALLGSLSLAAASVLLFFALRGERRPPDASRAVASAARELAKGAATQSPVQAAQGQASGGLEPLRLPSGNVPNERSWKDEGAFKSGNPRRSADADSEEVFELERITEAPSAEASEKPEEQGLAERAGLAKISERGLERDRKSAASRAPVGAVSASKATDLQSVKSSLHQVGVVGERRSLGATQKPPRTEEALRVRNSPRFARSTGPSSPKPVGKGGGAAGPSTAPITGGKAGLRLRSGRVARAKVGASPAKRRQVKKSPAAMLAYDRRLAGNYSLQIKGRRVQATVLQIDLYAKDLPVFDSILEEAGLERSEVMVNRAFVGLMTNSPQLGLALPKTLPKTLPIELQKSLSRSLPRSLPSTAGKATDKNKATKKSQAAGDLPRASPQRAPTERVRAALRYDRLVRIVGERKMLLRGTTALLQNKLWTSKESVLRIPGLGSAKKQGRPAKPDAQDKSGLLDDKSVARGRSKKQLQAMTKFRKRTKKQADAAKSVPLDSMRKDTALLLDSPRRDSRPRIDELRRVRAALEAAADSEVPSLLIYLRILDRLVPKTGSALEHAASKPAKKE